MKQSKIIEDSTFIIDSYNFDTQSNHLFGFMFMNNTAYANCDIPSDVEISSSAPGAFIAILNKKDCVEIIQDSLSTFYLFVYRDGDYFCLSNSFYLLCEHVTQAHSLTLNKPFAHQYMSTALVPTVVRETLANEVTIVPQFTKVIIDRSSKCITLNEEEVQFESVDIDSKEGMKTLDGWISRWGSFFNAVACRRKYPMQIDLTGGYDSRVIFALCAACGIDFNAENVYVYSLVPETEGMKKNKAGDIEIATEIAKKMGFRLNNHQNIFDKQKVSGEYSYEVFKASLMGFHTEGYFEQAVYNSTAFHLGGYNGEPVRGNWSSLNKWMDNIYNPIGVHPVVYKEFFTTYEGLREKCASDFECLRRLYLATRGRSHFGQQIFRDFLTGLFMLSPFYDLDLFKLRFPDDIEKDAIFALIIQRTCPLLMSIPYVNSDFGVKTKEYVKYLSEKYKPNLCFENVEINFERFDELDANPYDNTNPVGTGNDYLYNVFSDPIGKELFIAEFGTYGEQMYAYADDFFQDKERFFIINGALLSLR